MSLFLELDLHLIEAEMYLPNNHQFYHSPDEAVSSFLKQICTDLLNFVCSDHSRKINHDYMYNGWCTEPQILHIALTTQHRRAEGRLYSLKTMYDLLTKFETNTTMNCIHQHLLAGYFSLCNIKSDDGCTQLHHYFEGIQAASYDLQDQIQNVVHKLYDFLIECLKRCGNQKKQLQLLLIFALSTRFYPKDLNLVVKNELMSVLTHLSNAPSIFGCVITKPQLLNVSATRLIHIITISTCLHAKNVDLNTVEEVADKLYLQLVNITENGSSDRLLGDYLVFLRTLISEVVMQNLFATSKWIISLLSIINVRCGASNYTTHNYGLRPKLLVLQLLQKILTNPTNIDKELQQFIINEIFEQMTEEIWNMQKENKNYEITSQDETIGNTVTLHDMAFNSERCVNCIIEGGLTVYHGLGGRGYALGNRSIKSGCYQWKVLIVKEDKGNEGTCIGVSKYPVQDINHRTTADMWLYRAYSGSLYHKGEWDVSFQSYTQGDYITVILDMDSKTLSFGKNGEEPKVAFEDIDATELYPCVMFYSTKPGEKVKITDMQVGAFFYFINIT